MSSLIDALPEHVYVKTTNHIALNDIESLKKSKVDGRTQIAFNNVEHAVIYDERFGCHSKDSFFKRMWLKMMESTKPDPTDATLSQLSKSLKKLYVFGDWSLRAESIAQDFPNLEKMSEISIYFSLDFYVKYIKNIGHEHSKLKHIE